MMLDYSLQSPVQLFVDGIDFTSCLSALSFGLPAHEPEQKLAWAGSFSLRLSVAAVQSGLTEADLDPILANPARWAPGLKQVVVRFAQLGVDLKFRIASWAYDSRTATGQGSLAQQIDLYDRPYPEFDPETVYTSPAAGIAIDATVSALLDAVNAKTTVPFVKGSSGPSLGAVYGLRSTRNPMSEIQQYAKTSWSWLQQSLTAETVSVLPLDYNSSPSVFARAALQAEVVPSYDNIDFAAPKVIAHGSCDVPDECAGEDDPNAANNGAPKTQVTELLEPAGKIFPKLGTASTLYVSQRKTVKYHYVTDSVLIAPEFYPAYSPPLPVDGNGLYRTETIIEEPRGKIFPKLGTATALEVSSRTVETAQWKATWRPRGLIYKNAGPIFTLELESKEDLKTAPQRPGGSKSGRLANGKHGCIDKADPEVPRAVEVKLKQQAFKGEAAVSRGYTPALDYPLVYGMGFCPSQASADLVAARLAQREIMRQYADLVRLPLPVEWLAAGALQYASCQVGRKLYWIDSPVVDLTVDESGRQTASLSFTGLLRGYAATEPVVPTVAPYLPGLGDPLTATIPSQLESQEGTDFYVQLGG